MSKFFIFLLIVCLFLNLLVDANEREKRSSKSGHRRHRGSSSSGGRRYRTRVIYRRPTDPCRLSTRPRCGLNAFCAVQNGNAICVCQPHTFGDPYSACRVPQPQPPRDRCRNVQCGTNARCDRSDGHCKCISGYYGNPNFNHACIRPNQCAHVSCGINTKCENGICRCVTGFRGNPSYGHRCTRPLPLDPCRYIHCGGHAHCSGGRCICDRNCSGNPYTGCEPNKKG